MAVGTESDFNVRDPFFKLGQMEAAVSTENFFGPAMNNALVLRTENMVGNYVYRDFLKQLTTNITRRNTTSVSAATDIAPTEGQFVGVKISRKYGPVAFTESQLAKVGRTEEEIQMSLGRDFETLKLKDMRDTALLAIESFLTDETALTNDVTSASPDTIEPENLLATLQKFGDASDRIVAFFIHSIPWFTFSQALITDKVDQIYSGLIRAMQVPSFDRPFGVQDITALVDLNGSLDDTYNTLGLVEGAAIVTETNPDRVFFDRVSGLENLARRFQAEYDFTVELKGCAYDVANGGVNPTDATLATSGNWDQTATSDKDLPGVRLKSK